MAYPERFELPLAVLETVVLPLTLRIHCMGSPLGFEPRSLAFNASEDNFAVCILNRIAFF